MTATKPLRNLARPLVYRRGVSGSYTTSRVTTPRAEQSAWTTTFGTRLATTQHGQSGVPPTTPDQNETSPIVPQDTSTKEQDKPRRRQRVVILGSGWAGYALARDLDPAKYERIIVSPRSYFVFTPLLASTSVGTLEFRSVLEPVRRLLPDRFHQGWADGVDFARKTVRVETNPDADEVNSRTLPPLQSGGGGENQTTPVATASGISTGGQIQQQAEAGEAAAAIISPQAKGDLITVPYDKLIIAVGAYSQTFSIPGVREYANFLRDVGDARAIRLRVLQCFERADMLLARSANGDDKLDARRLLHFAIVGGGPTGVEFAAELHDLVRDDLARLYPSLVPLVSITVYDVAKGVLPMFDQRLSAYAVDLFKRQGISVKTEHHLLGIRPGDGAKGGLKLRIKEYGDDEVDAGMVVWSTGLMQNPLVGKLLREEFRRPLIKRKSAETGLEEVDSKTRTAAGKSADEQGDKGDLLEVLEDDKTGGIVVDDHLRVRVSLVNNNNNNNNKKAAANSPDVLPDVFAIGDCSVVEREALPATAQVASQQAKYLSRLLNKHGRGGNGTDTDAEALAVASAKPFHFRNLGTLAYVGSWRAIMQSSSSGSNRGEGLKGRLAWVLWRGAYITRSMSIRNRIMVLVHWVMTWLFGRDISRF